MPMHERHAPTGRGFKALLTTQFLNAFNDNAFKLIICLMARALIKDTTAFVALAGALFTLPFIVFSPWAGLLTDRFSKRNVAAGAKVAEVVILGFGCLALSHRSVSGMLAALFLLSVQSTFFSPAKYGLIPELLPEEELSRGNGKIELWTFLAIIAGTAAAEPLLRFFDGGIALPGGWRIGFEGRAHLTGVVLVGLAVAGVCASLRIPVTVSPGAGRKMQGGFLRETLAALVEIRKTRSLYLCVLGCAVFWFLGALLHMNLLSYAEKMSGSGDFRTGLMLTAVALGVGVGSALAGLWSGDKVEFGLVPLGAGMLSVFCAGLSLSSHSLGCSLVLLLLLGAGAGLYHVPLNTYIQQKSPPESLGRILAASSVTSAVAMLLASGLLWLLHAKAGASPAHVFLVTGVLLFAVLLVTLHLLPDFTVRLIGWALTHSVYRIRVMGKQNLPKTGGALLVCNHVSFADAVLLQVTTQRFIRFIMARDYYDSKWLNPLCRLMKAIPISTEDSPKALVASLHKASEYLQQGELVCIFAEGQITRTGHLQPFNRGLEVIMRKVEAPIIPVCLEGLWGSIFSHAHSRAKDKRHVRIPYPVTVAYGAALPNSASAWQVRQAVSELAADAFRARPRLDEPLSVKFLRQARKVPTRFCMADSSGRSFTYGQTMVAVLSMARALRRQRPREPMMGVMLPAGVGGVLANVSITLLGRCPVNLNFTASESAVNQAVAKCGLRTILTSREFLEKARIAERPDMLFVEDVVKTITPRDKAVATLVGTGLPLRLLARLLRDTRPDALPAPGLATVLFSSGSTGTPKGVMLSHANINTNIEGLNQVVPLAAEDRMLGILPFFHSFGLTATLWFPLTMGRGVVFHANPLEFGTVGELAARYEPAILCATPTFLLGYIRRCTAEQFRSLRHVVVGAEKLSVRIADAFTQRFGIRPLEGYGCTELSPIVALNVPDVTDGAIHQAGNKQGTVGHPLPGVTARAVDQETLEPVVGPDEPGLLLVKGANVMLGYLDDEERTREVMHGEWYVTGDIATVDADGFITIRDRLSRFSKIGGEMVPHLAIEEHIHTAAGAATDRVCVVTAVGDAKKGERLVVLYKTGSLDVENVHRALGAAGLPNLWIPRKESFFPIEEIPLLGSGKPDLKRIRTVATSFAETPAGPESPAA